MNGNKNATTARSPSNSLLHELTAPLSSPDTHLRTTARLIAILLFLRIPWIYPMISVEALPFYALYPLAPWMLQGRWHDLPKPPAGILRWTLVGAGLEVVFGLAGRYLVWAQSEGNLALVPRSFSISSLLLTVLYQAAYAGLSEGPLFRGLLWGYLGKLNWSVRKILIFQGSLFALAHPDALLVGWWLTPVFALVIGTIFGWLVWRSRSISVTITAHGLVNGIGTALQ